MAYIIKLSNGTPLVTITDGSQDVSSSSLSLFGKNFAGYGPLLNQNLVKLTENFANSIPPANPLQGQLWWDSVGKVMKVRDEAGWKVISGSAPRNSAPANNVEGDFWWNTADKQLNIYNGTDWTLVGPAYKATQGVSGALAETVQDVIGGTHEVVKLMVNGSIIAIMSKDLPFVTSSVGGFSVINPGITFSTYFSLQYYGNANNALNLGGVLAANYLRSDVESTTDNKLNIASNNGLTVGSNADLVVTVTPAEVAIDSNAQDKDITFHTNSGGIIKTALRIDGATGKVNVTDYPSTASGVANKGYVDDTLSSTLQHYIKDDGSVAIKATLLPSVDDSYSLGSNAYRFASVRATTVNAEAVIVANGQFVDSTVTMPPTTPTSVANKAYVDSTVSTGNTSSIAYVDNAMSTLKGNPPLTLQTLENLAAAVGNSPTFASDVNNALALKAPLASPALTGTPTAPTASAGTNTSQIATTNFVTTAISSKAPLVSPALTGTPTAPTATAGTNTTQIATTNFVKSAVDTGISALSTTINNTLASFDYNSLTNKPAITSVGITATIVPTVNNSYNLGSSTQKFNTVYATTFNGTSTQATYADVAERFAADQEYAPGTVVALGGVAEITSAVEDGSDEVFGVISTAPAHLMNAGAGNDITHPAVAISGRVPVRVIGKVRKGQRLISAGNGLARAAERHELTGFNVIGRSLENKITDDVDTVETIVRLNS